MSTSDLIAYGTANTSTCTGPIVTLPTGISTVTVIVQAFGGYAPCSVEIDGQISGTWQVLNTLSQNSWGHDGWGARVDVTSPFPTALQARVIECGGQHIGVIVETT